MGKYSYKESHIEWIGSIPKHWQIKKLKRILKSPLKYGANESAELDDEALPRYIRITDFADDGILKNNTFKSLPLDKAKNYFLEEGDILFARSGATVGKTFQFKNYNGLACYAGYLIKASPQPHLLDSDFLFFYTKSTAYEEWKNLIFTQSTIQNIGADKYQYLSVSLPPLTEQKAIADYLDKSTTKIDRIIVLKEKQIEKLESYFKSIIHEAVTKGLNKNVKLKPSGIEWIGDIPEHWSITKIKNEFKVIPSNVDKKSNDDESEVKLCNYVDVYYNDYISSSIDFMIATATDAEIKKFNLFVDDVIITKDSEDPFDIAVPAIVKKTSPALLCGYHLSFLRSINKKILGAFLFWSLKDDSIASQLHREATGITRWAISSRNIKNSILPFPPKDEQIIIIEYLEHLSQKTKTVKLRIEKQIETLKTFRKSLIHECVTGKKQIYKGEIKTR